MHAAYPLAKLHATFVRAHPCPGPWGHVLSPPRGGSTCGQHQALHPHLHPPPSAPILAAPLGAGVPCMGTLPVAGEWAGGDGCAGGSLGMVWSCAGLVGGGLHASPAAWAGQGAHFEAVTGAAPRPPAVPLPSPEETPPLPQEADGARGGWGGWWGAMWALLLGGAALQALFSSPALSTQP